jgi:aspartate oxidase
MGALAPRDVVARAIDARCSAARRDVLLDITHAKAFLIDRFPTYTAPARSSASTSPQPIPVVRRRTTCARV